MLPNRRLLAAVLALFVYPSLAQADAPASVSISTISTSTTTIVGSTQPWRISPHVPFRIGENLQFVLKWGVVVGGYAELKVPELVDISSRPAYHIVSTARSAGMVSAIYKVEDRNDVWLDQQALVTVRYEKKIREGKFRIEESSDLDQVQRRWKTRKLRIDKNKYEEKEGDLPPHALDPFGALYFVRASVLEPGQDLTIDVLDGDKVYPLLVKVIKREKVKVPAGKFKCIMVEPILRGPGIFVNKGKKLQVWITDDERRMPVRMRSEVFIGHVSAELTSDSQ